MLGGAPVLASVSHRRRALLSAGPGLERARSEMAGGVYTQPPCTRSLESELVMHLAPPESPREAAHFVNQSTITGAERPIRRRVWDMIVFGFELDMLRLHMLTLDASVDGFLVSEATVCFQTRTTKPALLTEAIAAGTLPAALARKAAVKVVTREVGAASCPDMVGRGRSHRYSPRCFQAVQRYATLELLATRAASDDLVLVSDVDEIASPSVVRLLQACAPFPRWRPSAPNAYIDGGHTASLWLEVHQHKYGVHCDTGASWFEGPRVYLAGWLPWLTRCTPLHPSPLRTDGVHRACLADGVAPCALQGGCSICTLAAFMAARATPTAARATSAAHTATPLHRP
jgi:hypothetical protein